MTKEICLDRACRPLCGVGEWTTTSPFRWGNVAIRPSSSQSVSTNETKYHLSSILNKPVQRFLPPVCSPPLSPSCHYIPAGTERERREVIQEARERGDRRLCPFNTRLILQSLFKAHHPSRWPRSSHSPAWQPAPRAPSRPRRSAWARASARRGSRALPSRC